MRAGSRSPLVSGERRGRSVVVVVVVVVVVGGAVVVVVVVVVVARAVRRVGRRRAVVRVGPGADGDHLHAVRRVRQPHVLGLASGDGAAVEHAVGDLQVVVERAGARLVANPELVLTAVIAVDRPADGGHPHVRRAGGGERRGRGARGRRARGGRGRRRGGRRRGRRDGGRSWWSWWWRGAVVDHRAVVRRARGAELAEGAEGGGRRCTSWRDRCCRRRGRRARPRRRPPRADGDRPSR